MVGTGFVALGLALAFLIVFSSIATTTARSLQGGHGADRRDVLKGVVALGTSGLIVGSMGGEAMQQLVNAQTAGGAGDCTIAGGDVLRVQSGETETCGTIIWEESGTLRMDNSSTLEVTG